MVSRSIAILSAAMFLFATISTVSAMSVTVGPSPAYMDKGQHITMLASVTNGTATNYTWFNNNVQVQGCSTDECTISAMSIGRHTISVNVSNATASASAIGYVSVFSNVRAPKIHIQGHKNKVKLNTTIELHASKKNGGTGRYSYLWMDNGRTLSCTSNNCSFVANQTGIQNITVSILDVGTTTPPVQPDERATSKVKQIIVTS